MRKNWKNSVSLNTLFDGFDKTMAIRFGCLKPVSLIFIMFLLFACGGRNESAHVHGGYTCPMHPTVVSDKRGACPVCGMDLVRKESHAEEIKVTEDIATLRKSPNEAVVSSIATINPVFKTIPVSTHATGVITYDTRKLYAVSSRVSGRIEKMFLKYEFQQVKKGQPMAVIYSPEIRTAQRELLYLIENDPTNEQLIYGAKNKLKLLGLPESQIGNLVTRKEAGDTFTLYSQYSGYLITNDAPVVSIGIPQGNGRSEMGGMKSTPPAGLSSLIQSGSSPILLREGDYVTAGQVLFKIVNTNALRVELDLKNIPTESIQVGDKIILDLGEKKGVTATVDFIQPFFNEGTTFTKARVYLKGIETFSIGELVSATVSLEAREALWLPEKAVMDLGIDRIVFVKERDAFKSRTITTGLKTDDLIEITSGLASSDEVAANAHYLVDNEGFVK
ncbi:MAG TPA: efflux RND transporter periplasmic adaptor subunit [Ohtaekwangia sp.]|nr:efflux RND transporter periplasmic adaptor subunit [Ohtaekwangia sp.]